MIEARAVSKRYSEKVAVKDLTFTVRPGVVTRSSGRTGREVDHDPHDHGLDTPTSGEVTVTASNTPNIRLRCGRSVTHFHASPPTM